jgi:hypothetical protein
MNLRGQQIKKALKENDCIDGIKGIESMRY